MMKWKEKRKLQYLRIGVRSLYVYVYYYNCSAIELNYLGYVCSSNSNNSSNSNIQPCLHGWVKQCCTQRINLCKCSQTTASFIWANSHRITHTLSFTRSYKHTLTNTVTERETNRHTNTLTKAEKESRANQPSNRTISSLRFFFLSYIYSF